MLKKILRYLFPNQYKSLAYWRQYRHATNHLLGNHFQEREKLFDEMVQRSLGHPSLQIGVRNQKYAPHWTSVDLFDTADYIDFNYDVQDMPFEDESFDFIACNAVLEHIPYLEKAIAEFLCLLKPNGEVWIEIPLNQPYHPSPQDYWRVTPEGMQIWMRDFEEIHIGLLSPYKSSIYKCNFLSRQETY